MPGVTKHIYDHEIRDILCMWKNELRSIMNILPKNYLEEDIIASLKYYYPHEWESVNIKYLYYQKKDKSIRKHKGKNRYNMPKPEDLIKKVYIYIKINKAEYKKEYNLKFNQQEVENNKSILWNKRKQKIERIDKKIEVSLLKTQQVTPSFIWKLIGLYERKNTSQKDKMYIISELKKYYSPQIMNFFYKLNDTELNKQLRNIAFKHLQSFNYHPRARKQKYMVIKTKNKKRRKYLKTVYPNETYNIPNNPEELEYRIENSKEQKIKEFDYFISHSSNDKDSVQKLITYENKHKKNIFCDWINDVDYLKRHLVCDATLKVIEKRLEQSKALIFVSSNNSLKSVWCKYELNYFLGLNKTIYIINKQDIDNDTFNIKEVKKYWFKDSNYKKIALIEGGKIGS